MTAKLKILYMYSVAALNLDGIYAIWTTYGGG